MNDWWSKWADQRFWLEATDRADIGADLRAPEADESGKDNWRYTLFKAANPGDVVLHYDSGSERNGIVAWSRIAGPPQSAPITWAARGSYARDKGVTPHDRAGYVVPLRDHKKLAAPITLDRLRALEPLLGALVSDLKRRYGEPLYFPFEISGKRPLRPLQGYAFKLPREIVALFPELAPLLKDAQIGSPASTQRNPAWNRDELILALELYLRNPAAPPSKASKEVIELSQLLNRMSRSITSGLAEDFRNPAGVYMKMMNFRRFDPEFTAAGRVGLTRGNKDEEVVWKEFANDKARLVQVANAIRSAVNQAGAELQHIDEDEEGEEAPEGRILTRLHRVRERSRKLVSQRKSKALRELGYLRCEVCEFDFETAYGERGRGFIEVHHTRALATLVGESKTKLEDLALLCANCHRMIHSRRPWLSLDELRTVIRE